MIEMICVKNKLTQKIVTASMLASLICVATMIIKIPSPLKGYINLGDGIVLICGWVLSPAYGFLASGIGASLADVFSGYAIYAPVTFFIKGIMALIAYWGYIFFHKKLGSKISRIISAILSEVLMVSGYLLFEGILYSFGAAVINITANVVQGTAGIIIGAILVNMFEKHKLFK